MPVGIVAVVSMNTIMKKNRAITAVSSRPARKKPLVPQIPYPPMEKPSFSSTVPGPMGEYHAGPTGALYQLPQPSA